MTIARTTNGFLPYNLFHKADTRIHSHGAQVKKEGSRAAQMMPNNNNMNQQQQQPLQNSNQFPNVGMINGLPQFPLVNQQQQQPQFFPTQNAGQTQEQALLQNTIQNIYQLLQLQQQQNNITNTNNTYAAQNPMFQNVMMPQNLPFVVNQQLPMSNAQLVNPNMVQGNPFLQPASVLTQQQQNLISPFTYFQALQQNQIVQGVGPQNHNFPTNQLFGMANLNGPLQLINQGQQRFPSPLMDVNASRQLVHAGQTHNPTNLEANHGNVPANNGWVESQHKNSTGHKTNDASVKGFKSHKHVKDKFGKAGSNRFAAVDSSPRTSTGSEKKIPPPNYTEQEIKQWREARKKNYPTKVTELKKCTAEQTLSDVTNQEAALRRQELKAILEKQAELGIEVAEIPSYYHSDPDDQNPRGSNSSGHRKQSHRGQKHGRERNKKGKFQNKRRTRFQDNQVTKRPKKEFAKRHPSLLQKLLSRDIKRDKNHLLQVFRFMAVNSFFTGESNNSLTFPSVVVRETDPDVPEVTVLKDSKKAVEETSCSVLQDSEKEEEGELTE
ncbi:Nuclear fragile X mental retardation-interacting protein 1, conserved domain-containing protein [Artemisia annua]|uniref:Nuclear fragile X mental retardation-interacting protein 1, conserved domain-containing protein n=1 Tax=Artemisia annua TaxID=35608 RepID=A0A2U1QA29_ARTAN|nr:Nuclear fragile X mental retardation-interacting protein 1, conserved domain-containing protein [Artemisia annua]